MTDKIQLSQKGIEEQEQILSDFKIKMADAYQDALMWFADLTAFDLMSEEYADFKGQIIGELKGNYEVLKFFTKEELEDVLAHIAKNHKDSIYKRVFDDYQQKIKELQKETEQYYPF